ncbi:MAG: tetratricopeptide repeat protein [Myxococcota bacterium]
MDDEGARKAWMALVTRYPKSQYAAEVNLRIGETLFDFAEYKDAAKYYTAVLNYPESSYYDKALYKLAWSHFQDYDYDSAIKTFKRLLAWYHDQNKTGATASALREEAVDYLALSLTEDDWDADGEIDPDAGVQRALGYLNGGTVWEREIIRAYAKGLYDLQDNKKWPEAIEVYNYLLKSDPLDVEGPEYMKIVVLIHDEMGKIDLAADARQRMVRLFGPKSDWWAKNAKTPEIQSKMAKALEQTLRQRALYHHERAQALKVQGLSEEDEAVLAESVDQYTKAAAAYREYIETYPNEPASYEMTFFYAEALWYSGDHVAAAPVYQQVATHAHHTTYRETAAWSMIKAYEKDMETLGEAGQFDLRFVPASDWEAPLPPEDEEASSELKQIVAEPIPKKTQVWIAAVDLFVAGDMKVNGSREAQSQIAYNAADMYFRANDFKEARRRFRQVITCYPGDVVAANAIANIINTYREENDWTNLEKWANKAERLNLGDPNQQKEIRAAIKIFKLGSMFKRAEALYKDEKYLEAAREFERLATQNPDQSFADKAFYNAADAYKREKYYDSAARVFERLVTDPRYKDSEFAEESLFELAETNKIFFNFDEAIDGYRTLYERYPEGKNRKYAFFQIASLLQAAGKLREAAEEYERYIDAYPEAKEAAGALYQVGLLYERVEDVKQQRRIWKLFISRHNETVGMESLVIEALGKLSDIALAKKDKRAHKKLRVQILEEYKARNMQPKTPAAYVAAKAQFQIIEETFAIYNKLRVKSSDLKKAGETINKKKAMLQDLQTQYQNLADYQSFEWVVAAVYRIADLYAEFAQMIYKVPEPKGLDDEELDMYVTQIEDMGLQFENIAIQRYEQAVGESRRLKVTNEWSKRALVAINKFKPDDYPLFKEEKSKTVFSPTYTLDNRAPQAR